MFSQHATLRLEALVKDTRECMLTEEYSFFAVGLIPREQNLRMLCLRYSLNKHLIEFIQGPSVEKQLLKKLSTTMFFRQVRFLFIFFNGPMPACFSLFLSFSELQLTDIHR